MNFSKFVQMLYIYIGGNEAKNQFVISITCEIMEASFSKDEHPLYDKKSDTLEKIFSGKRELSKEDARIILLHLDKDAFANYLSKFSDDVLDLIGKGMQDHGIIFAVCEVIDSCTDLFVQVLENCAKGVNITQSPEEQITLINQNYIFTQGHKLFNRTQKDKRIAHKIREIFEESNPKYHMTDFIRDSIGDRIEASTPDFKEGSLNDIHGFIETIYEYGLEMEYYNEATELFQALNKYIDKSLYNDSPCSPDEIAKFCEEIILLLLDFYDYDESLGE